MNTSLYIQLVFTVISDYFVSGILLVSGIKTKRIGFN